MQPQFIEMLTGQDGSTTLHFQLFPRQPGTAAHWTVDEEPNESNIVESTAHVLPLPRERIDEHAD